MIYETVFIFSRVRASAVFFLINDLVKGSPGSRSVFLSVPRPARVPAAQS